MVDRPNISQTALGVFRDCPFAYYCYKSKKEAIFFDTKYLDSGKFIHDALDGYYQRCYLTSGTSEDILSRTYDVLKDVWDTTLPIDEFKKAYTCLENHANWEAKNINNGGTKPLTEIEVKTDFWYGLIDYVDLANKNVIDWKTGKFASLSFAYRMQASIYKELYEYQFKEKLKEFTFFFLYPNEFKVVEFGEPKQIEVEKEILALKEQIIKAWDNNDFPKSPRMDNMCKNCNYRLYCQY